MSFDTRCYPSILYASTAYKRSSQIPNKLIQKDYKQLSNIHIFLLENLPSKSNPGLLFPHGHMNPLI